MIKKYLLCICFGLALNMAITAEPAQSADNQNKNLVDVEEAVFTEIQKMLNKDKLPPYMQDIIRKAISTELEGLARDLIIQKIQKAKEDNNFNLLSREEKQQQQKIQREQALKEAEEEKLRQGEEKKHREYEEMREKKGWIQQEIINPGLTACHIYFLTQKSHYIGSAFKLNFFSLLDAGDKEALKIKRGRLEIFMELGLYRRLFDQAMPNYLFEYSSGFNISFESSKYLRRTFLIPYYGLKIGGFYLSKNEAYNIDYSGSFFCSPNFGIAIINEEKISSGFDVALDLNTKEFPDYLAMQSKVFINFSF